MTHFIRTLSNQPALPVPAGAVAGDWDQLTDAPDDLLRFLTWSRHDAAGVLNLKDVSCWIGGFPQAIRHDYLRVRLADVTAWSWGIRH